MIARAALVACAVLAACSSKSRAPRPGPADTAASRAAERPNAGPDVRWYGALHAIMHESRTESAVKLADVVPGPHAWALGALEGLNGEVTVLDDEVWMARPMPDGTATITRGDLAGANSKQGAALFVVAHVAAWQEVPIADEVPWERLDSFLETQLRAHGLMGDRPVALRIEGPVSGLKWHVVDGSKLVPGAGHAEHARTAVSGILPATDAQLVGFFSTNHQGVFTHAGSHSHFHTLVRNPLVSGHVDAVELRPGSRLLIATQ